MFHPKVGKMATPKSSIYSATKFAVLGFSNALRLELKATQYSSYDRQS